MTMGGANNLELVLEIMGRTPATHNIDEASRSLRNLDAEQQRNQQTARRHAAENEHLGGSFNVSRESMLRFASSLVGVELGLNLASGAARNLHDLVITGTEVFKEAEQRQNAVGAAYGATSREINRFAANLRESAGIAESQTKEAALQAVTLQKNYGISIEQTEKLIELSANLAQVRGISTANAFERVQSAIRGEAEASEYLGLTLNANFLKQHAANGQYAQSYETLGDVSRAQIIYTEALKQGSIYAGLAANSNNTLAGASNRVAAEAERAFAAIGKMSAPVVVSGLNALATALKGAITFLQPEPDTGSASANRQEALEKFQKQLDKVHDSQQQVILAQDKLTGKMVVQAAPGASFDLVTDQVNSLNKALVDLFYVARPANTQVQVLFTESSNAALAMDSLTKNIQALSQAAGQFSQVSNALERGQGLLGVSDDEVALVSRLRAETALLTIEAGNYARARSATIALERQLQEVVQQNQGGGTDVAERRRAQDRLNALREIQEAEQNVTALQREQADAAQELEKAQRPLLENTQALSDERVKLLGYAERQRDLEAQLNTIADRRLALTQEEAQLRARQAGLGPNRALEDARTRQQELQLIARTDPSQRAAAGAELRGLARQIPQLELSALQANRGQTAADRAREDVDVARDIRNIGVRRQQIDVAEVTEPIDRVIARLNDEVQAHREAATAAQVHYDDLKARATDAANTLQDVEGRVRDRLATPIPAPQAPGRVGGLDNPATAAAADRGEPEGLGGGRISVQVQIINPRFGQGVVADPASLQAAGQAAGQAGWAAFVDHLESNDPRFPSKRVTPAKPTRP